MPWNQALFLAEAFWCWHVSPEYVAVFMKRRTKLGSSGVLEASREHARSHAEPKGNRILAGRGHVNRELVVFDGREMADQIHLNQEAGTVTAVSRLDIRPTFDLMGQTHALDEKVHTPKARGALEVAPTSNSAPQTGDGQVRGIVDSGSN